MPSKPFGVDRNLRNSATLRPFVQDAQPVRVDAGNDLSLELSVRKLYAL